MILSEGDSISADARLVEDSDLRVNQVHADRGISSGFQVQGHRDAHGPQPRRTPEPCFRRKRAFPPAPEKAVVFSTGMDTEFGKIASLTQGMKEEMNPLQKEMARVTKLVSAMAVSIGAFFFVLAIFLAGVNMRRASSSPWNDRRVHSEGLLPTVTLSLAMGVQRMSKRHALVKRMSAVETRAARPSYARIRPAPSPRTR